MSQITRRARVPRAYVERRLKQQESKCFWCDEYLKPGYHVDHVIPVALGGADVPENTVIVHPRCNGLKRDKLPWEYQDSQLWLQKEARLNEWTSGKFGAYLSTWRQKPKGVTSGEARRYRGRKRHKRTKWDWLHEDHWTTGEPMLDRALARGFRMHWGYEPSTAEAYRGHARFLISISRENKDIYHFGRAATQSFREERPELWQGFADRYGLAISYADMRRELLERKDDIEMLLYGEYEGFDDYLLFLALDVFRDLWERISEP